MNALHLDPATGFLESASPGSLTFDSGKKVRFLELATAYRQAKKFPKVSDICDEIGLNIRTFERHLELDTNFAAAWKEISTHIEYQCISDMSDLRVKNPMYMFGLLRYLNPKRWNPNEKHDVSISLNVFGDAIKELPTYKEGEIVSASPAIAPQTEALPSESQILGRDLTGGDK